MKTVSKISLIVFVIALILLPRLYKFGQVPHGFYVDEASQAYNAYSILLTGKDEFAKSMPIVFRSFVDFKTPIYTYLLVPFIKILGLNTFSARLPSLIFSLLAITFLFSLIKNLSVRKNPLLSYICIILIAISPWHAVFGRSVFEVNISLFFLIAGIWSFYKSFNFFKSKNYSPNWFIPTSIFWSLGIITYHSQRVVIPLVMFVFLLRYKDILLKNIFRKQLIIGVVVGFLILLPTLFISTSPGFLKRATGLNIFSAQNNPAGYMENYDGILKPIVNNKLYLSTKEFSALYFSYHLPRNMFVLGDSDLRSGLPELSTFYLWQFPFYIYGLIKLINMKKDKEFRFLILVLLFISPIPAAITRDPYSTIRSLNLLIPQIIIIGLGITEFYKETKVFIAKKKLIYVHLYKISIAFTFGLVIFYSLSKLWSSMFILNEHFRASKWNYGWLEVSRTINTLDNNLPIIVDNARSEAYSELLFFLRFDPSYYQRDNFEVDAINYYSSMDRNTTKVIANITTRPINWDIDTKNEVYLIGDSLAISNNQIIEHNLEVVQIITYPDWTTAFVIVKTPNQDSR